MLRITWNQYQTVKVSIIFGKFKIREMKVKGQFNK